MFEIKGFSIHSLILRFIKSWSLLQISTLKFYKHFVKELTSSLLKEIFQNNCSYNNFYNL
ncbi:hypothetical protein A0H76_489 [Hepatospora eriocheir]|uniref:Uncharacterized protein n=1 Tax=Hepatospora eriocheir TaxID=1081669 RepID=A0A1X0Q8Z1_9MICR|nr:hypothetical protein A0H76_489 [Hepatospora eriocheir]